ncbi:hypothetical protein [Akkermansia glycaniphila]|uniref:Uncharacterized protein n=1 Tax=Akkermansia glycaniphila TaxID=1679444 RepID=A0A1C7PCN0_9BACT|nr:hypothetical protein [Akkermansia glycaniphila]OCA03333.1 hypothetical protein AC781_05575 [Akkermansia glycaniphila]SEH80413.1 Hypothetical protein PYTT_0877 [Akkermansia glycaniphila]
MNCIHPILAAALLAFPQSYAETEPSDNRPAAELTAPLDTGLTAEQKKALHHLYAAAALSELTYLDTLYNRNPEEASTEDPSISYYPRNYFRLLASPFQAIADSPELAKLPPELSSLIQEAGKQAREVIELLERQPVEKPRLVTAVQALEQTRSRINEHLLHRYGINAEWLRACTYHRLNLLHNSIAWPKGFATSSRDLEDENPDSATALQMAYDALRDELPLDIPLHSERSRHIIEYEEVKQLNRDIYFLKNMHTRWQQHAQYRMELETMPDSSRLPEDLQTIIAEQRTLLQALSKPRRTPYLMQQIVGTFGNKRWAEERMAEWDRNKKRLLTRREEYHRMIEQKTKGEAGAYYQYTVYISAALPFRYIDSARKALDLPPGDADPYRYLLSLPPKQQEQLSERACLMLCEEWQKNGIPQ